MFKEQFPQMTSFKAVTCMLADFLCKLSDNTHGVEFLEFEVKDYDSGRSVFKVCVFKELNER